MAAKKGLGKGLDSLIPSKPIESAKEVSDQNAVENARSSQMQSSHEKHLMKML